MNANIEKKREITLKKQLEILNLFENIFQKLRQDIVNLFKEVNKSIDTEEINLRLSNKRKHTFSESIKKKLKLEKRVNFNDSIEIIDLIEISDKEDDLESTLILEED